MIKNMLSVILVLLASVCIFTFSAVCNQFANRTLEDKEKIGIENEEIPEEEKTETQIVETEEVEVAESETDREEETKKEEAEEQEEKTPPTLNLEVYEGPLYSETDRVCYYRIEAIVTGNPVPSVNFSKDDSGGAWGKYKAQVNLYDPSETYTLKVTATNSEGVSTDSIELSWGCEADEGFEISEIEKDDIKKIIEGVDTGQTVHPYTVLNPSNIGYVVYPSGVNTTTCFIGDSISNTDVKGFFAFDVSTLAGKDVISATLYMEGTIIGDPSFKGTVTLRWGTYLPLDAGDYLMLGLVRPVDTFNNGQNPIVFSREDLAVAIENCANIYHEKLQFGITYYNDTTDGDNLLDGREYRTEDISLIIYYEN